MINAIITYHDNDVDLGDYFTGSHTDLTNHFDNKPIAITSIAGDNCTEQFVNATITGLRGVRFIFIAVAHGNEDIVAANEAFVSQNNVVQFNNSLFYSCSCLNGASLGNKLIAAGCLAFVGYMKVVTVILDYLAVFYTCQNFGIKSFLETAEILSMSFQKMHDYYTSEINRLLTGSTDDIIAASYLIANRDALILLGDGNLTSNDFKIQINGDA